MGIHPVRAGIAIAVVAATIYFMIVGVAVVDAWWAILGSVVAFYFVSN